MMRANDDDLLRLFKRIHGEMTGSCHAAVVINDDGEAEAIACMKNGAVAWQATLAELACDALLLTLTDD